MRALVRYGSSLALMLLAACAVNADKEKEAKKMTSSAQSEVAFAPMQTTQYVQTGKPAPEGKVPQDFGTPPQLFWIRSETGFAKYGYQKTAPAAGAPAPGSNAAGEPDFSKHDVILLTMGVQGTTGYSITLESIRKTGMEVRFLAKTKSPGPGDMVGEALTHPALLVKVEKLPKDARLVVEMDGKEASIQQKILE